MSIVIDDRDRKVLEYIKGFAGEYGYPPSVREICKHLNIKSTATVYFSIHRLESAGFLRQSPSKKRSIEVLNPYGIPKKKMIEIPLVGQIAAGQPITAIENVEDIYTVPDEMFGKGNLFMLTVTGESMIKAGIFDGDKVVVRKQESADNGEIVVAMINGEATVKRLYVEGETIRLQPENDTMKPIITDSVEILGKVVGLIRRI